MKKIRWEKIEKKILKILDIKIDISVVVVMLLGELLLLNICLFTTKKEYSYIDMNGSAGTSSDCYYDENSRDLRCMIPVRIQQYFEGR